MFLDPLYIILMLVTIVLAGGAAFMVKSRFNKGLKVPISSGYTGAQVAEALLRNAGISNVSVYMHQGFLSDHYNPMKRTLHLSPEVYNGRSAAAAGVAAHEVGHAIQHAQDYFPMWIRSTIVPAANIGSRLGPWIVIAGIMLGAGAEMSHGIGHTLAVVGVALFGVATLFSLVTVPVEFDASARAKEHLQQMGIIRPGAEANAVSSVLTAAGLTYVAAAINSLLSLIYWAYRAGLIGGRR
ncbi:MAG: zinc metallopeptidase [Fibromonadaceae bacterium]|jgi:Zn-dependent membrane protease YugP|nr:zinc metallopeptidase [Fibromonadaceae bacterium]